MIPMILGAMVFLLSPVYALGQGKGDVEGSSGTLFVHGALTESACRLEMASAHQDVLLGEIGTGRLQKIAPVEDLSGLNCIWKIVFLSWERSRTVKFFHGLIQSIFMCGLVLWKVCADRSLRQ